MQMNLDRKSPRLSRQRLIVVAAVSAAFLCCPYVLFRVASHNGWIIVTHGAHRVAVGRPPALGNVEQEWSLFVVGDTGAATEQRRRVVSMMHQQAGPADVDAVMLLGDNFYERGVTSVNDPRFDTDFENVFDRQLLACPFYVCLGNHDYYGNVEAQLEYQLKSERWKMPARYYSFRHPLPGANVDVFVVDTIPIDRDDASAREQVAWLDRELSDSDAAWKIMIGHHPILSGGNHGSSANVAAALTPLMNQYDVDFYLSGHDHDLQLLDSGNGWHQVVSGSGSKLRSTHWIRQTEFAAATPGFCWLLIRPSEVFVTFYSVEGRLVTKRIAKADPRPQQRPATTELLKL